MKEVINLRKSFDRLGKWSLGMPFDDKKYIVRGFSLKEISSERFFLFKNNHELSSIQFFLGEKNRILHTILVNSGDIDIIWEKFHVFDTSYQFLKHKLSMYANDWEIELMDVFYIYSAQLGVIIGFPLKSSYNMNKSEAEVLVASLCPCKIIITSEKNDIFGVLMGFV